MRIYTVTSQRADYDGWPLGPQSTYFVGTDLDTARRVLKSVKDLYGYTNQVELSFYVDNAVPEVFESVNGRKFLTSLSSTRLTDRQPDAILE